jgi:hypothetical protein
MAHGPCGLFMLTLGQRAFLCSFERQQVMPLPGIAQIAKEIAREIAAQRPLTGLSPLGDAMARDPAAPGLTLDALLAEAKAKAPRANMIHAYVEMLGAAMSALRMDMENGSKAAGQTIDKLIARIAGAGRSGLLPQETLMLLGGQMAQAKIPPSAELRAVMETRAHTAPREEFVPDEMESSMAKLAAGFGHDPFQTFAQLQEMTAVMPDEARGGFAGYMLHAKTRSLRKAALGFLLDPTPAVAAEVGAALVASADKGLVRPDAQRYLILLRPWLSASLRATVDDALRRARRAPPQAHQAGEKFAAVEHMPAAGELREMLINAPDGAGAQSAFILLKTARKFSLAAVLVKHGFGVRDAWIMDNMSDAKAQEMIDHMDEEVGVFDASLPVLRRLLAHGLAENLVTGEPPPFGLVQILEMTGMGPLEAERQTPAGMVARLVADMPPHETGAANRAAALKASAVWRDVYQFADTWFEASDEIKAALAGAKTKTKRMNLLLDKLLPPLRERWAGQLAWTAEILRESEPDGDWSDMALTADALLSGAPLREIPLMRHIAEFTELADRSGPRG